METIVKRFSFASPEYGQALELRYRILRQPLGMQFTQQELKKDENDIHFGLFEGRRILACLILSLADNDRVKMRQVAVEADMQGKGLGAKLATAAEEYARTNGFKTMFCAARDTAVPFYQKLGYAIVGERFLEIGIPHYIMEKEL